MANNPNFGTDRAGCVTTEGTQQEFVILMYILTQTLIISMRLYDFLTVLKWNEIEIFSGLLSLMYLKILSFKLVCKNLNETFFSLWFLFSNLLN